MKNSFFLIVLIFFSACKLTSEREFDVPFEGKKLVTIGFIGADKGVETYVTSTVPTINGKQDSLSDVVVNLYENEVLVNTLKLDSGLYKTSANFKVKEDKTYRIDVKALNYTPLSTNALKLPLATKIDTIEWQFKDSTKEYIQLNTVFKDAKDKNYYAIKVDKYHGDTLFQEDAPTGFRFLNPVDVFDDDKFDNKVARILRKIYVYDRNRKINRLKIRLYALDEATYYFFKTLGTQDFVKGDYFLEPTKVYSNIKSGYGVWGAYSLTAAEIKW